MIKYSVVILCYFFISALAFYEWDLESPNKRQFRYNTAQQVWEKAHRQNKDRTKLKKLYGELVDYDKKAVEWKELHHSGGDEDGLLEAELREQIHGIMVNNSIISADRAKKYYGNSRFQHAKLDTLWLQVEDKGLFSPSELQQLEVEFRHHRDKLNDFHELQQEIKKSQNDAANDIDNAHKAMATGKQKDMKKLSMQIDDGYQRLQLKIKQAEGHDVTFTEPRVEKLWRMALDDNMTDEEKESLKEELKHFEVRLEKRRYYEQQLKNSHRKLEHHGTDKPELEERHSHIENRFQQISQTVKKIGHQLGKKFGLHNVLRHYEL